MPSTTAKSTGRRAGVGVEEDYDRIWRWSLPSSLVDDRGELACQIRREVHGSAGPPGPCVSKSDMVPEVDRSV